MKFDFAVHADAHADIASAVTWASDNGLVSVADDQAILKWAATPGDAVPSSSSALSGSASGTGASEVASSSDGSGSGMTPSAIGTSDSYVTSLSWCPSLGKGSSAGGGGDMFAMSCTDGTFRFMTRSGRQDKKVEAHRGAVVVVRWSYDGSALISAGEDGDVKIWSRTGNARSTLLQTGAPVYALCWGPDNDQVLVAAGHSLIIKTVQVGRRELRWNAHEGVVLAVDWNSTNNLIVSGGEDCCYRVWDSFGRQLFQSQPLEHVVTSVSWCPSGECFAVGAFNVLRLCDRTGWTHSRERPQTGSLFCLSWSKDGTQIAAACGNGSLLFGQLIQRQVEWRDFEVRLIKPRTVRVTNLASESYDDLQFERDHVVEMAVGFDFLVVATVTQCYVYNVQNLTTPIIFDLRHPVHTILLCSRHFATIDQTDGVQIWSYEGRGLCSPRFQNMRPEFVNRHSVAVSPDAIAIVDTADAKIVHLFDPSSGRPLQNARLHHSTDIAEVSFNQYALGIADRRLAFVDKNRDLYIAVVNPVTGTERGSSAAAAARNKFKIHTHVDTVKWNDVSDALAAVADGQLVIWYYPNVVFVDRDLLPMTMESKDGSEFGKLPTMVAFNGSRITVRRADGSLRVDTSTSFVALLYELVQGGRWAESVRLCRFVKEDAMWGCLATMAIDKRELGTAEVALAALKEIDKLRFIQHIQAIPSEEGRSAELALYRRRPDEAERILLQAHPPLVYRAIKLNIRLFRWRRALDLATKHGTHVDTVIGYRNRFLEQFNQQETDKAFLRAAQGVSIDWDVIRENKERDKDIERQHGDGGASMRK